MNLVDEWPQFRRDIPYSNESKLNTLQTCIPRPTSTGNHERIWVIYLHGGAWRDPSQTAATFDKAQDILLASPVVSQIAAFASINYRLSPASSHTTSPSNATDPARNARHPDHVNDVLAAILHLQETYRFSHRYLLVGHSCGATLALQVAMKRHWDSLSNPSQAVGMKVDPPMAILGIEGLYDLPALVKYHASQPFYHAFVESAFGPSEDSWRTASPTASSLNQSWLGGKLVVIAHSHDDELVEWEQPDLMMQSLGSQGFENTGKRRMKLLELKGRHDQMWEEGVEVARAIEWAIGELKSP